MRLATFVLIAFAVAVPWAAARAQNTGGGGSDVGGNATATATGTESQALSASAATHNVTGYGYSDPKPTTTHSLVVHSGTRAVAAHHRTTASATGPIATLPGFEMLGEGGSRLFVELSQTVQVEERRARGIITYVLKGAHVTIRNNENPLVTVHFNTPVTRARLVPAGRDVLFVVDLRADVTPTWKINPAKEGSAILTVEFPKGTYLSGNTAD